MRAKLGMALLAIALIGGGLYAAGVALAHVNRSQLVKEIESYCDNRGGGSGLNITSVVQNYIKPGMTITETVAYFEAMHFSVHQSWTAKTLYVADYRSPLGFRWFNVVKHYRFVLHVSDGRLQRFQGTAEIDSP